MKVGSDPEDDCPALLGVAVPRSSSTTAVARILLVLLVFMHLALCSSTVRRLEERSSLSWHGDVRTVDASVFDEFHLKSGQHFDEPFLFWQTFLAVRAFSQHSFLSPRALTLVSARGLPGCRSRRELYSQVTWHQLVSVTACCNDRCGVTIHTHQVVSETTTTTTTTTT